MDDKSEIQLPSWKEEELKSYLYFKLVKPDSSLLPRTREMKLWNQETVSAAAIAEWISDSITLGWGEEYMFISQTILQIKQVTHYSYIGGA